MDTTVFDRPNPSELFLRARNLAGQHLERLFTKFNEGKNEPFHQFRWIKTELTSPSFEHLTFGYKNAVFAILVAVIYKGKSRLPADDLRLLCSEALKYNFVPCVFGVRFSPLEFDANGCVHGVYGKSGYQIRVADDGWGLRHAQTGELIDPLDYGKDVDTVMSEWELQNFAISIAKQHGVEKGGFALDSYCDIPGISPQMWFHDKAGQKSWAIVRFQKVLDESAANEYSDFVERHPHLNLTSYDGYFVPVSAAMSDAIVKDANGNIVPLSKRFDGSSPIYRGHGMYINFKRMIKIHAADPKGLIMSIWRRHDELVRQHDDLKRPYNELMRQHDDLKLQSNALKKKWFVSRRKERLNSFEDELKRLSEKLSAMGSELERIDEKFEKIDDDLFAAVVSSCHVANLSPVQKHGFDVLHAALDMSRGFISIEPDQDKMEDALAAMENVASADTDERKEWFKSFFGIFKNLSLASGWRLTAMTRKDDFGGRAEFFVTNDHGEFCKNPLDRMSISGNPSLGAIEAAMFQFAITQMDLHWHSFYDQGCVVKDVPSLVRDKVKIRPIILKFAKSEKVWNFCSTDFSPSVSSLQDDLYNVRYVICRTHAGTVGFIERIAEVRNKGFIGDLNLRYEHLYTYDSGVRF